MSLRTSPRGLALIKAFESCKLTAYKCPAGTWTVGYGHTGPDVGPNTAVTQDQAEALFNADIDRFENQVEKLTAKVVLADCEFDALVSFAFNVGIRNFKSSTLLKKVLARDYQAVPAQLLRWNKIEDPKTHMMEESDGLTRRRRAEGALWAGDFEDCETYAQMTFPPMPQAVAPPQPPKSMAQSKAGNTSVVAGIGGTVLGAKAVLDQVQQVAQPVSQVTAAAQQVTSTLQASAQQGQAAVAATQQTVQTVQQTVTPLAAHMHHHLPTLVQLAPAMPWAMLTLLVVTGAVYVWHDRRKKLTEDGV